jgi:hypothetical protein
MSSKLNIGSVIWNATTGVEQGTILHSNALKTVNGTSLVGSGDLKPSLTLLGSRNTTGDITIAPSNGLDTVLVFRIGAFTSATVATKTIKLNDLSSNTTYQASLYAGDTLIVNFYRNAGGTIITVTNNAPNVYTLFVEELKVN